MCVSLGFRRLSLMICRLINSNLKTEGAISSETSVYLYQTIRRQCQDTATLQSDTTERQARRCINGSSNNGPMKQKASFRQLPVQTCSNGHKWGLCRRLCSDRTATASSTFRSAGNERCCHGNKRLLHGRPTDNLRVAYVRIKVRPHRTRSAAADCGLCPLRNVTF